MTALIRRASSAGAVVLLVSLASPPGAHAEEQRVTITADGVTPRVLVLARGDTVRFVNEDGSFAYRARSTGGAWRFDSGPTALLQGDFVVPHPLTQPGTYTYRVAQDEPFSGTVVLAAASGPEGAEAPVPAAATQPSPSAAAPATDVAPGAAPPVPGTLAGERTGRAFGLPTALAAVLVAGVGSLLLRLLLAEPVLSEGRGTL